MRNGNQSLWAWSTVGRSQRRCWNGTLLANLSEGFGVQGYATAFEVEVRAEGGVVLGRCSYWSGFRSANPLLEYLYEGRVTLNGSLVK